jgi:glucoamylase
MLPAVAQHIFALMRRNLATDGFVFVDPGAGTISAAGATMASPTYPDPPVPDGQGGPQDCLFNWVRDAAITALVIAAPSAPLADAQRAQHLSRPPRGNSRVARASTRPL